MDPILSKLWEVSPLLAFLGLAVFYFYKRDKANDVKAEKRYAECESRNAKLEARVETLEDRQFNQLAVLTKDGINGLADVYASIKRLLRDEDTPPGSFPAKRQP